MAAKKTQFSRRESQVIQRIARGMTGPEVAAELGIGYEAVRNYLRRARKKKNVHSQLELNNYIIVSDSEEDTLP